MAQLKSYSGSLHHRPPLSHQEHSGPCYASLSSAGKGRVAHCGLQIHANGSCWCRVKQKSKFLHPLRCSKSLDRDPEGSEDYAQMDELTLESELDAAIRSENYSKAAKLRDEIRALQEDNRSGVLAANAKFYKAFAFGDLKMMRSIWASGDNVHCIHPGAGRISGYDMVMASWELMLGPETSLPLRIELEDMEVQVQGNLAFVSCMEVVRTSGTSWGKQLATNIFEKQNGSWYICMHHASHITF